MVGRSQARITFRLSKTKSRLCRSIFNQPHHDPSFCSSVYISAPSVDLCKYRIYPNLSVDTAGPVRAKALGSSELQPWTTSNLLQLLILVKNVGILYKSTFVLDAITARTIAGPPYSTQHVLRDGSSRELRTITRKSLV